MACYESEHGEITLSAKNFNLLLLILKAKYKSEMEESYYAALRIYEAIKQDKSKLSNNNIFNDLFLLSRERDNSYFVSHQNVIKRNELKIRSELFRKECVVNDLCDPNYFESEGKYKLFKPRKSSFAPLTNRVKSFQFELDDYDSGSITMDFETKKVTWDVLYCNGKVNYYRTSAYGILFHDFLNNTKLTKKEMYVLNYENEYEDDNDC